MEWATFTLDSNTLFVKDGSTLTNRTFVAVKGADGGYGVALYDGKYPKGKCRRKNANELKARVRPRSKFRLLPSPLSRYREVF